MSTDTGAEVAEKGRVSAPAVRRARPALRVLGTSVTQTRAMTEAARQELGLAFDFITLDGMQAQRQGALRPDSFDVYDQWFHDVDLIWPTGSVQPIDVRRIDRWDEINALPKTGRLRPDLPLARGGVVTGAILSFAHTVGEFGVVLMIGGNIPGETRGLSIAIYDAVEQGDWSAAPQMSAGLLAFAFVVILTTTLIEKRAGRRGR